MRTRIISLALTLCFLLTACGGKEESSQGRASFLARAAELEEEELLLVVGGREIPAWRYLYWLGWVCDRLQKQYDRAELPLDWAATIGGGTLADYAREQALADTALYATVENLAEEFGLSAEENFVSAALPDEGLTPEQMTELERVGQLYAALYDFYCTEGSPLAPTEEALREFAQEQGWLTVEHILIPHGEDREAARGQTEEVFARLNSGAEQVEFQSKQTFRAGESTMDEALETAAAEMAVGQCSGILETEEGFFILRRLETEVEALREDYFDDLLQRRAEESAVEVTEAYRLLEVPEFYRRLQRLREESA